MKVAQKASAALVIIGALFAQTEFFTTSTTQVGPGVIHKKISAPIKPWLLDVLIIDLQNPYLALETVKAANRLTAYEKTSSMAARTSSEGHRVVCGTNADFYDTGSGTPIGTQISNGEILKTSSGWWSLGFNIYNQPMIELTSFFGSVTASTGTNSVSTINATRSTDYLVLYNSYYGSTTNTNEWGTEAVIVPVDDWIVNDTVRCVVESVNIGVGNMSIPDNKAILSGHGASDTFLQGLTAGDTLKLFLGLTPALPKLDQLVGGNRKILEDGLYTGSTNTDRHPRTFAGINADSTILYLATVDGRQMGSIGMTYREQADFMADLGAEHVINLDGGGSTTMVIGSQVENSLYTAERAVSNSLMIISSAPQGTLASIQIRPDNFRIFRGFRQALSVTGWDENFNPVDLNSAEIQYNIDQIYGTIDSQGGFQTVDENISGYLTVQYQGLTDTAHFYLKTIQSVSLEPECQMTDNRHGIVYQTTAIDEDNLIQEIGRSRYTWEVLNPEVGYFDSTGTFYGLQEGTSKIVATYLGESDTAEVQVRIGEGSAVIDSMETAGDWVLSGELYDQANTSLTTAATPVTFGNYSLQLDYQFIRSSAGRSWIYLDQDIPVYGLPDSLLFDFKSNPDPQKTHMVVVVIEDNDGEEFQASITTPDTNFISYGLALSDFGAITENGILHYPITIKAIQLRLGYYSAVDDTNTATVYFDNFRAVYPDPLGVIEPDGTQIPDQFELYQNWPNPFNSTTVIGYRLNNPANVRLTIYDLLGREVKTLINGIQDSGIKNFSWIGDNNQGLPVSSGIYLYSLEVDNQIATRKMILIK